MTTIMCCLLCNRLPCNQIYNIQTIWETKGSWWSRSYGSLSYKLYMQSVLITTKVVSSNPTYGEVHSIQPYAIKIFSEFGQVVDFFRTRFPQLIKLTATI